MKKLLLFLLLLPTLVSAQWQQVGNTLQRTADTKKYRFNLGSPGFMYLYTQSQVDSIANTLLTGVGTSGYITEYVSTGFSRTLANSTIYNSPLVPSIGINTTTFNPVNPEALLVQSPSGSTSYNGIINIGNVNNYYQIKVKNTNAGTSASSDIVAEANDGSETTNYVDLGINSSAYTDGAVGIAHDSYLLNQGGALYLGTTSANSLNLFTNNNWASPALSITSAGSVLVNGSPIGGLPTNYPLLNGSFVLGNSIAYGYLNPGLYNFTTPLQSKYGISLNSLAVSATGIRFAYAQYSKNKSFCYSLPLLVGAPDFNNMRGTLSPTTAYYNTCMAGNRAVAALHFLNTIKLPYSGNFASVNPDFSFSTGTWAGAGSEAVLLDYGSRTYWYRHNDPNNATANLVFKASVVANETLTVSNVQGTAIVIGTWGTDGATNNWSRIQYAVDGITIGTYTPNGQTYAIGYPDGGTTDGLMNDAIVVTGLSDGNHIVVLTFLDGGKPSYIDYVGTLCSATASVAFPLYRMDMFHMSNGVNIGYNYPGGQTTGAILDNASNQVITNLQSTFPSYAIIRVQTNKYFSPETDATQTNSDGIHPTVYGDALIAKGIYDYISTNQIVGTSVPSFGGSFGSSTFSTAVNAPNFVTNNTATGNVVLANFSGSPGTGNLNGVSEYVLNNTAGTAKAQFAIGGNTHVWEFITDPAGTNDQRFVLYNGLTGTYAFTFDANGNYQVGGLGSLSLLTANAAFEIYKNGSYPYLSLSSSTATHGDIFSISNTGIVTIGANTLGLGSSFTYRGGAQATLVAGTKAVTVTGTTTSSRAYVTVVSQAGTFTTTVQYKGVCTANTVTVTAVTNAGATDATDTSVVNVEVFN